MKLSVAMNICDEHEYIRESIQSVQDIADEVILVLDTKSSDTTEKIVTEMALENEKIKVIKHIWVTGTLQKTYTIRSATGAKTGDWILFMDGDEVLSDNAYLIKDIIQDTEYDCFKIEGYHFIGNYGLIDATLPKHYWVGRLFKKTKTIGMSGLNHAILLGYSNEGILPDVRIFHFGYCKNMHSIKLKHKKDMKYKQFHPVDYLQWWKNAHYYGFYPIKPYRGDYPSVLKLENADEVRRKYNVRQDTPR